MATLTTTISYGEPTGSIVTTLGTPGPQGIPGQQGPAGPQGPAGAGVPAGGSTGTVLKKLSGADYDTGWATPGATIWGAIQGTISNQTDLQSILDGKYSTSNPSGFVDGPYVARELIGYATQAWVIGQGYLTESSLSGYATEAWVNNALTPYATQTYVNSLGFITASALSPYLLSSDAASTYQTISGMSSYAPKASPTFTGTVTIPAGASISGYLTTATAASTYLTIASASSTYAPKANPTLTGTVTIPTPATSSNTTVAASTAFVKAQGYATLASPTFTGTVTIPSGASISGYLTTSTAASTYAVTARGLPASGTTGQILAKNSGTSYDVSWTTFVPGDRYLTTSTTSNSVSDGAKTFTVQTGLSYTPTQDCTIAYDAANHMHATVTTYNSSTGVLVVDVNQHSGTGTYTAWTVNVGGAVPSTTIAWGDITGTIGSQSDLSTILNSKLASADAATTYQTLSGMSSYLTTSSAASTYQPISGMSSYPTFTDADGRYLQLSGGAMAVNSSITIADSGIGSDSEMGGFGFGVENTSHSQQATLEFGGVSITSSVVGSYGTNVNTATIQGDSANFSYTGYDSNGAFSGATNYNFGGLGLSYTATGISQSMSLNASGISSSYSNFGSTNNWSLDGTNGIQWNNGTANGQFGPSGIRFADGSTQTTAYTGGGSVSWGSISGSISSQTDLQSALDGKYSSSNPSNFVDGSGAINAISNGYTSSVNNSPSGGQFLKYNGSQLEWSSPSGGSPPYSESVWIYNQWYSATIQTVYNTSYSYVNVLTF